jgi:phosphoglycolate phosphatase
VRTKVRSVRLRETFVPFMCALSRLEEMIKINREIPISTLKLFIFDLDGTLVDSRQDLANSINAMLAHYGKPTLPCDVIATYIGDGAPMLVRRSLGDPEDDHFVHEALDFFLSYYREHKLDTTYVYDGVMPSLEAIRAAANGTGKRIMSVLSNKPVNPSKAIVEALGMGNFFRQIYGGNSFHTKKPDPLGVHTLLKENGCKPEEAVIIGDSDIDILTARNAGIYSCGVLYGLAPHTLEAAPPDVLIDHPAELAKVFG